MSEEPLRCPFCGKKPTVEYACLAYEIKCPNRKCPGFSAAYYDTKEEAVAAWNHRSPQSTPQVVMSEDAYNNKIAEAFEFGLEAGRRGKQQPTPQVPDDVLAALQMAYRKHHLMDNSIGWDELSDTLLNVLCEVMGDRGYQAWLQRQRPPKEELNDI